MGGTLLAASRRQDAGHLCVVPRRGQAGYLGEREPFDNIEKLTLLIPPPRFHTLRFHGVLAPHAAWRSAVIPGRPEAEAEGPPAAVGSPRESASRWAALLRRVFALDVFACPRCGGRRRLVGVHTGGEPLRALLERLGLGSASPSAEPSRSPPRASQ
jgi:hypothetical protein